VFAAATRHRWAHSDALKAANASARPTTTASIALMRGAYEPSRRGETVTRERAHMPTAIAASWGQWHARCCRRWRVAAVVDHAARAVSYAALRARCFESLTMLARRPHQPSCTGETTRPRGTSTDAGRHAPRSPRPVPRPRRRSGNALPGATLAVCGSPVRPWFPEVAGARSFKARPHAGVVCTAAQAARSERRDLAGDHAPLHLSPQPSRPRGTLSWQVLVSTSHDLN
jgi:hypothetical protein